MEGFTWNGLCSGAVKGNELAIGTEGAGGPGKVSCDCNSCSKLEGIGGSIGSIKSKVVVISTE